MMGLTEASTTSMTIQKLAAGANLIRTINKDTMGAKLSRSRAKAISYQDSSKIALLSADLSTSQVCYDGTRLILENKENVDRKKLYINFEDVDVRLQSPGEWLRTGHRIEKYTKQGYTLDNTLADWNRFLTSETLWVRPFRYTKTFQTHWNSINIEDLPKLIFTARKENGTNRLYMFLRMGKKMTSMPWESLSKAEQKSAVQFVNVDIISNQFADSFFPFEPLKCFDRVIEWLGFNLIFGTRVDL
jgi:hypothetical protein